jgi:pyoverdine/dityrosine biosynthesis protein Dit1
MSSKKIRIQIFSDGQIKADVLGVKGKKCTDYISILEELLEAETIDSEYTAEYYETEQLEVEQELNQPMTLYSWEER